MDLKFDSSGHKKHNSEKSVIPFTTKLQFHAGNGLLSSWVVTQAMRPTQSMSAMVCGGEGPGMW